MKDSINIAMLGTRVKLEKFSRMINETEGCRVACLWDPDWEKAQKDAASINVPAVQDVDDIFADPDINAVMIIAATRLHAELLKKAVAAGKDIFVEKPMCLDADDAREIRDAVLKQGLHFFMSDPFVGATTVWTRKAIADGLIGKPVSARVRMCSINDRALRQDEEGIRIEVSEMGGGMVSDLGGHLFHVIQFLFGMPEQISARFAYRDDISRKYGREEYAGMLMTYPDDFTVACECSLMEPGFTNGVEINGTKGTIIELGSFGHNRSVRYCLYEAPEKPGPGVPIPENWVEVPDEELPADPLQHVDYWLKMLKEDISQEQFDVDMQGTRGVNVIRAAELVQIRDAVIKAATE